MKLLMIYNRYAGSRRAEKIYSQVEQEFTNKNITLETRFTEHQGHGVDLVCDADFNQYDGIVAAGGDGTLFEVVNGYYKNASEKRIPLGVLPVGTGNAFARDLNLHADHWKDAVSVIAKNKPKKVDVGHFRCQDKDYYYLNILGLGFVSDVGKTAKSFKWMGNVAYTIGVLYQIIRLGTHKLTIEVDGQTLEQDNIFVEVSNTTYTSNFLMSPNAKIDDGLLDVTILRKLTRRKLLKFFPKVFTGEHIHLPEIDTFQAKHVKIRTNIKKILSPDGELIGFTPVDITCLHQDIEVFWE